MKVKGVLCKKCRKQFTRPYSHRLHFVLTDGPVSPPRCMSTKELQDAGWVKIFSKWNFNHWTAGSGYLSGLPRRKPVVNKPLDIILENMVG